MAQTIFDTRHRADDLLQEAIQIWRQSNYSEHLEGLEKDPVFSLLMSAIAWQANETDNEIVRIREEVLEEYAQALVPYESAHAVPATLTVKVQPNTEIGEVELDHQSTFRLGENAWPFMPVFHTRVLNLHTSNITRIDGRRWRITLVSDHPLRDLSYFTFTLATAEFRNVHFSIDGKPLPLIHPWEYSELPLTAPFELDNALYSHQPHYNPASAVLDLFARQNLRTYMVRPHAPNLFFAAETNRFTLDVEFTGITTEFRFSPDMFHLNTVLLANAFIEEVTLDGKNPIARITGNGDEQVQNSQLMHLIRPAEEQLYAQSRVRVRRVNADRFNQATLVRLLASLIDKIQTDYYAFQYLRLPQGTALLSHLRTFLQKMLKATRHNDTSNISGTYLILEDLAQVTLNLRYVMTNGAAVNTSLKSSTHLTPPSGINNASVSTIGEYSPGQDEIDHRGATEMVRYHIITADRIVTMADIRAFCFNQLLQTYSITRSMVSEIRIAPRLAAEPHNKHNACGYEIGVTISIIRTPFVQRSFVDKISQAEILLEKMMSVRSANIYPIIVNIEVQ